MSARHASAVRPPKFSCHTRQAYTPPCSYRKGTIQKHTQPKPFLQSPCSFSSVGSSSDTPSMHAAIGSRRRRPRTLRCFPPTHSHPLHVPHLDRRLRKKTRAPTVPNFYFCSTSNSMTKQR